MARDIWCKGSCLRSFAIICNNQFKLAKKNRFRFYPSLIEIRRTELTRWSTSFPGDALSPSTFLQSASKTNKNQVDKVHFPQIWFLWGAGEARRALHPADQHLQREDLHLPLVLDAHPWRPHCPGRRLPICSLHLLLTAHIPFQVALQKVRTTPTSPPRMLWCIITMRNVDQWSSRWSPLRSGSSRSAWSWWWRRQQLGIGSFSISLDRTLITSFLRWSGRWWLVEIWGGPQTKFHRSNKTTNFLGIWFLERNDLPFHALSLWVIQLKFEPAM